MLKFAAFSSDIEISFYASLASHKINHDKLNDSARKVLGVYEVKSSETPAAFCRMQLRGNALTSEDVPSNCYRAEGWIKNYNTIEDYKNSDKSAVLDRAARTIWEAISDGTIYSCPSLLASFTILCFADLKKYKFTYLCGFPALHSEGTWRIVNESITTGQTSPSAVETGPSRHMKVHESGALVEAVQTWRYSVDTRQWGFFLAKKLPQRQPSDKDSNAATDERRNSEQTQENMWIIGALSEYERGFFDGHNPHDCFVAFADPSTYEQHPGWPLRNLLVLARKRWRLNSLQILCYRDIHARRHEARSLILNLRCDAVSTQIPAEMPKTTGWERGSTGKVTSKTVNLSEYLDPSRLADQAVDLNLKLIKWRIAPTLNLDVIKNTRCLLLGAGTLGSYVSRNLMGWGVKKITLVDSGAVSFSNPVRQPLFNFEDCLGGGAPKAERAASALKEIYPGIDATGHRISIPMAGHPIVDEATTLAEYEQLKELFSEHDVVFLLTDTRESRWLPTVLGKATGKLVMNAALGFDTYLVMRHGVTNPGDPDQELGCYFCNDVVAPVDSMSDRTLDQQCTVTRPGVAAIASAMLVELMVSVLQDPQGPMVDTASREEHPLGSVPHTIRGFLGSWSTMNVVGKSYSQCSACSPTITQAWKEQGWEFVKRALNERDFVAELSGLAELQRQAEKMASAVEWDDEGSAGDGLEDEGELI